MDLPLLDYDQTPEAVIEPNRDEGYQVPAKMLFAFVSRENIARFVARYPHTVCADYHTISNDYQVFALTIGEATIGLCQAPLGAPAATQLLDFLIGYGATTIIAVGSCGVLVDHPENALLVVTQALRDEGTSFHYLPAAARVAPDLALTQHVLTQLGARAKPVITWNNDAYYRETSQKIAKAKALGATVVEMECAALAACAQFRHVRLAQVLFTADSLAALDAYDARDFGAAAHLPALAVGVDCLVTAPVG